MKTEEEEEKKIRSLKGDVLEEFEGMWVDVIHRTQG